MAAPIFTGASSLTTSTGNMTVSWPSHASDDIGLLLLQSSNETIVLGTPASFSEVSGSPVFVNSFSTDSAVRLAVYWSRATRSNMGDVTVTDPGNHVMGGIAVFSGCTKTGIPWITFSASTYNTASSAVTVPGGTTTVDECLVVAMNATPRDVTGPQYSNWRNADLDSVTEIIDYFTNLSFGGTIGAATGALTAAGSFSETTATLGGSTNAFQANLMLALRPHVVSGGGGPAGTTSSKLGRRFRIPEVPSHLTGELAQYLKLVVRQLNGEGYISLFSGANPNTSAITGIPGNMLINIGSASTWTRLWVQAGSVASISTSSWHPVRMA